MRLVEYVRQHRLIEILIWCLGAFVSGAVLLVCALVLYLDPQIPDAESYRKYQYETPLRIFSNDGALIAEFGSRRLNPIALADAPQAYIDALISTEDKRFYRHSGIDWISFANDMVDVTFGSGVKRGASTITMQLPRNIADLSREQTVVRKLKEMLLALKIEREMTKDEILELYINVVPFGKHSYGLKAASYTYYNRHPRDLNLAQLAMLAGVPKLPEAGNPINGPEWALDRRNLVLRRMLTEQKITQAEFDEASSQPITAQVFHRELDLPSPFPAEIIRQELVGRFGSNIYSGYVVQTTIRSDHQHAAQEAIRNHLENYDRRYGYRGAEKSIDFGVDDIETAFVDVPTIGDMVPAVVSDVLKNQVRALLQNGQEISIEWEQLRWARKYLGEAGVGRVPRNAAEIVNLGDVIRIRENEGKWELTQVPEVSGAIVAIDPSSGEITAMVGGYNFADNQFNHATQAQRQPGSGFKPFVYSAALDAGRSASSIYLDGPLVFDDEHLETAYRPRNDSGRYRGPITLREALYRSVNLVSIRVLRDIGARTVVDFAQRFGFDSSKMPQNTQLAIGGGTMLVTPLEMARAYAVLANGGYKVESHLLNRVFNRNGQVLYEAVFPMVCPDCSGTSVELIPDSIITALQGDEPLMLESGTFERSVPKVEAPRVVEERNVFLMNSMLRDVVKRGTGARAGRELSRSDLAGKTGTTDEATDIWFNGFHPKLAASVWVGFSTVRPLGEREYGSTRPLAIWIDFMKSVLNDYPEEPLSPPEGIVRVLIDAKTGELASPDDPNAFYEYFREEQSPVTLGDSEYSSADNQLKPEEIF